MELPREVVESPPLGEFILNFDSPTDSGKMIRA